MPSRERNGPMAHSGVPSLSWLCTEQCVGGRGRNEGRDRYDPTPFDQVPIVQPGLLADEPVAMARRTQGSMVWNLRRTSYRRGPMGGSRYPPPRPYYRPPAPWSTMTAIGATPPMYTSAVHPPRKRGNFSGASPRCSGGGDYSVVDAVRAIGRLEPCIAAQVGRRALDGGRDATRR